MTLPSFTMRQLLEAGVHFGHHTRRWNPKMAPFLFGERNRVHIIDLRQTVPMLHRALQAVRDTVAGGGRVLCVGTKRQAADIIAESAKRCGQYYVNHRWLGGMLTNWKTISVSIRRLRELEEQLEGENLGFTKKELLQLTRERDKLERALGGIKDMGGQPDILFVVDTNKESIAIAEATKLGIPVVAVVDSNSDPDGVTHPIPGNDDAMRAIQMYCDLVSGAVLDGLQAELQAQGVDVGESPDAPAEDLPEGEAPEEAAKPAEAKPAKKSRGAKKPKATKADGEAAEAPAGEAEAEAQAAQAPAAEGEAEAEAAESPAAEAEAKQNGEASAEAAAALAAEAEAAASEPEAEAPAAEAEEKAASKAKKD